MPYALISGHPGGLTLGTYVGIVQDLLTFIANFWPRTGALDCFCCSFEARYTGKTHRICNIATILKMKDLDRRDWVSPLNGKKRLRMFLTLSPV